MPRPINQKKTLSSSVSQKARGTLSRSLFVSPALGVPPARVRGWWPSSPSSLDHQTRHPSRPGNGTCWAGPLFK
jgi:hypothetical protein